jgi:hypothetical protein
MKYLLNQRGNIDDIRCSLQFGYSEKDILDALENEKLNQNRQTVIKMLEAKLRKLLKQPK